MFLIKGELFFYLKVTLRKQVLQQSLRSFSLNKHEFLKIFQNQKLCLFLLGSKA